jgi:hypothetical protein
VGLCQAGAFARLRAGASAEAVLETYYPGAKLLPITERAPLSLTQGTEFTELTQPKEICSPWTAVISVSKGGGVID